MTTTVNEIYNSDNSVVQLSIDKGFMSLSMTINITTQAGKDTYNDAIETFVGGRPDDRK